MKILDRYIGTSFFQYFLLILFVLGFLFSFIEFIAQLDDVGKGSYDVMDAFFYVLLTVPSRLLYLIPVCSLLGSIIALGLMADHHELVAMRAGGVSMQRICWSVIAAGTLPMAVAICLSEFVAPPLEQHAQANRLAALADTEITLTKSGFWARNGPYFIHVRTLNHGIAPADVDIFEWDDKGTLRQFIHARKVHVTNDNRWILRDIEKKSITGNAITTQSLEELTFESFLNRKQMALQELPPESLSSSDLYNYIQLLRQTGQNADQYELVFWQKLSTPVATGAMVLLSLTFVFGPTRGTTAGFRIMTGSIIGVMVHFLNQILEHLALILGTHLALAALSPIAIILLLALWLLSRAP